MTTELTFNVFDTGVAREPQRAAELLEAMGRNGIGARQALAELLFGNPGRISALPSAASIHAGHPKSGPLRIKREHEVAEACANWAMAEIRQGKLGELKQRLPEIEALEPPEPLYPRSLRQNGTGQRQSHERARHGQASGQRLSGAQPRNG